MLVLLSILLPFYSTYNESSRFQRYCIYYSRIDLPKIGRPFN